MDLFSLSDEDQAAAAPLAARLRPRTLAEFVGQDHIVGPGTVLRGAIERGEVFSMILWGPPGCGKTTLARVIAAETGARLAQLSAVAAGTADVRAAIKGAHEARALSAARTILFIDEIHRFNKAQQDAVLHAVEDGVVTLIGATTENPYFEVNSALLSRCQLYRLEPLSADLVEGLVGVALEDRERGLGGRAVTVEDGGTALSRRGLAWRRPRRAERARDGVAVAGAEAGGGVALVDRRPARRRPEEPRRLRPRGRPLRHHLGLHQVDARQRPGCRRLLRRLDARRRRGPASSSRDA